MTSPTTVPSNTATVPAPARASAPARGTLLRRGTAFLLDLAVVGIVPLAMAGGGIDLVAVPLGVPLWLTTPGWAAVPVNVAAVVLWAGVFALVPLTGEQRTPGMYATGLRVADAEDRDRAPSAVQHAIRTALLVVDGALLGLPGLVAVLRSGGRRLGDLAAGTVVVRAAATRR
jgi:uncharacterized RDD family membrane protein YckC